MRNSTPPRSRAPPRLCTIAGALPSKATPSSSCATSFFTSTQLTRASDCHTVNSILLLPPLGCSPVPLSLCSCRSQFPFGAVVDHGLPFKSFLFVFYVIFSVGLFDLTSTDGPVNTVIYIHKCHIYFTPPYHFTFKTLYLRFPLPPLLPSCHRLFSFSHPSLLLNSFHCLSPFLFRSRFELLPALPHACHE